MRPQSAHATKTNSEWKQCAQAKLPLALPALERVHTPYSAIVTDTPWTTVVPNQLDRRCEVMRHAQSKLPFGYTARDRADKAEKLRLSPRPRRGLMMYHVPEISRFALVNSMPPAHDRKFVKSAQPVGVSLRKTHNPGRYGWVR